MKIRTALKVARIEANLTQNKLASKVGVTQQTIAKWELGITTPNHFKHLRALELTLNKPAALLFPDIFMNTHSPDPVVNKII